MDEVGKYIEQGYKAIRAQSGVPGPEDRLWRRARARCSTSPPMPALPERARLVDARSICDFVPKLFAAARDDWASTSHLLHDVHHRLTPIEAARLGKDPGALSPVLAGGRDAGREPGRLPPDPPAHHHAARGRRGVQHDLGLQAADREAADRLYPRHRGPCRRHHPSAPHRRSWPSSTRCAPAATAPPTCRRSAWGRRCISTSRCRISASRNTCATPRRPTRCSRTPTRFDDGFLHPGEVPGHGVDIDETLAAKYPYERAYLPVNRLEDGTMWNW